MVRRSDMVFLAALAGGLYVAWLARDVLLLVYVSALFAVVITPAVHLVQRIRVGRWRPGRGISILLILLAGVLVIASFAAFVLPPIFRDVQGLVADWPHRAATLSTRLRQIPIVNRLDAQALQQHLAAASGNVVGVFAGIAGGVMWLFSLLILTAYFVVDGDGAFHWALTLVPERHRQRLHDTALRAERRVRHWLVGQGLLMLALGMASAIAFGVLRLKYFYALALFAAITNIVPIIGPLASAVLACAVASFDSWEKVVGVVAFYLIYQQIENAVLTPRIMRSTLDLPPLAVIVALSLGGALAGIVGALVAVPTAAVIAVVLDEYVAKPQSAPETTSTATQF